MQTIFLPVKHLKLITVHAFLCKCFSIFINAPFIWNSLPVRISSTPTYSAFKSSLLSFCSVYPNFVFNFLYVPCYCLLFVCFFFMFGEHTSSASMCTAQVVCPVLRLSEVSVCSQLSTVPESCRVHCDEFIGIACNWV